jgi:hypothetical protein
VIVTRLSGRRRRWRRWRRDDALAVRCRPLRRLRRSGGERARWRLQLRDREADLIARDDIGGVAERHGAEEADESDRENCEASFALT